MLGDELEAEGANTSAPDGAAEHDPSTRAHVPRAEARALARQAAETRRLNEQEQNQKTVDSIKCYAAAHATSEEQRRHMDSALDMLMSEDPERARREFAQARRTHDAITRVLPRTAACGAREPARRTT